jgi:hypothetical protein
MTVYYDDTRAYFTHRLFPYAGASAREPGYIDFTQQPELIEVPSKISCRFPIRLPDAR